VSVPPSLILVTDPRFGLEQTVAVVTHVARAVGPGRLLVQLRDKASEAGVVHAAARVLRDVTRRERAMLVVNDRASIAHDVGADGLHLPSQATPLASRIAAARALLGEDAWVTTAAHDDDDVRAALAGGATAVLVSPIFATPGKGSARGVTALASARAIVDAARRPLPLLVYALGGITRQNADSCAEAGADGVAAIRSLYDATDPGVIATALALVEPFLRGGRSGTRGRVLTSPS